MGPVASFSRLRESGIDREDLFWLSKSPVFKKVTSLEVNESTLYSADFRCLGFGRSFQNLKSIKFQTDRFSATFGLLNLANLVRELSFSDLEIITEEPIKEDTDFRDALCRLRPQTELVVNHRVICHEERTAWRSYDLN